MAECIPAFRVVRVVCRAKVLPQTGSGTPGSPTFNFLLPQHAVTHDASSLPPRPPPHPPPAPAPPRSAPSTTVWPRRQRRFPEPPTQWPRPPTAWEERKAAGQVDRSAGRQEDRSAGTHVIPTQPALQVEGTSSARPLAVGLLVGARCPAHWPPRRPTIQAITNKAPAPRLVSNATACRGPVLPHPPHPPPPFTIKGSRNW